MGLCNDVKREQRHLAPCRVSDVYEQYILQHRSDGEAASRTTFMRVWQLWSPHVLHIRQVGQHARCAECAKLDKYASDAHKVGDQE